MIFFVFGYLAFAASTLSIVIYELTHVSRDNVSLSDLIILSFLSLLPAANVLMLLSASYMIFKYWIQRASIDVNPIIFKRKEK